VRNRFFVDAELTAGDVVSLSGDERHHARVLRVREGEEVEVFNGRGTSYAGKFESADVIRIASPTANRELHIAITLAMAVIQPDKFELVLQKATELGVASVVPLLTDRTEVRVERVKGKQERWQKIVFEAVKQSGRARIPIVEEPRALADVLQREGAKIIFDADETPTATGPLESDATLFVGPEGGWSEDELRLAHERGCVFRRLGERRLRAETAAIVAVAVMSLRAVR
jgi:16S rRNA (uracil1498-N3)-methyltransferase